MKFSFSDCGGCRSCELACSYQKSSEFNLNNSAIKIRQLPQGGFEIVLQESASGSVYCDGCKDEEEPMCIQYCHSKEKLAEYVLKMRDFIKEEEKESCLSRQIQV